MYADYNNNLEIICCNLFKISSDFYAAREKKTAAAQPEN